MKTYQITMSRSRWMSLLIAVLLIAMLVQLCLPYFTYGADTLSFVPPEGGNEKILEGTWVLSGSDASQDGYKEIVIKGGKMTVNTTNIIRVSQVNADSAVEACKDDFDIVAKSLAACEVANAKVQALKVAMDEVYAFVAQKTGSDPENADFAAVAANQKKVDAAVDTAKTNTEAAAAALVSVQDSVNQARDAAIEAYSADASFAWITETSEAKNEELHAYYLPDYKEENTTRVRDELVAAAKAKQLDADKKAEYERLKALEANAGKKKAEIEAQIDMKALEAAIDVKAINDSITDETVETELMKQFEDMLANMLGAERDSVLDDQLAGYKATANDAAAKAADAQKVADAAAKEAEKTYQKKAEKAFTDAEKEYNKAVEVAKTLDAEKVFGSEFEGASEVQQLVYTDYDKTSSEKAMMTTEGKAKYNEKKGTLKLTFANGDEFEVPFGASFSYNEVKKLSILGYVGFPFNVEDFSAEMVYKIEDFYINDVVLLPIVILVLAIIGIVLCFIKRDKMSSGFIPAILGVVGIIGYLTSDFLKLGDCYTTHIISYAVILVVAAAHIALHVVDKKKAK